MIFLKKYLTRGRSSIEDGGGGGCEMWGRHSGIVSVRVVRGMWGGRVGGRVAALVSG